MSKHQYTVPECIQGQCDQIRYSRWLNRKAATHARRDRKRERPCTIARYKEEIHSAVCASGHRDFYTGELLNWTLVSTYDNESAKTGRAKYRRTLRSLPTLDHTEDEHGQAKFVICSSYVNDAKSDLTLSEFYQLCELVLKQRDERILNV